MADIQDKKNHSGGKILIFNKFLRKLCDRFSLQVAAIAGVISIISFLVFLSHKSFDFSFIEASICLLIFVLSAYIWNFARKTLKANLKRSPIFVSTINSKESLSFDPENILGNMGSFIVAFDKANKKLLTANCDNEKYHIYDFSYVLKWYYEWDVGSSSNMHVGVGNNIPGTLMREPTITTTREEYKKNFTLVLEVADVNKPFIKFSMLGEREAKLWCAKLDALFHGA